MSLALHDACKEGSLSKAKAVINEHSNKLCYAQDGDGCLPLHYACRYESLELVKLVSNGCDVNTLSCIKPDGNKSHWKCERSYKINEACGQTPLHIACRAGNLDAVQFLHLKSADTDAGRLNCFKQSLLHIACKANKRGSLSVIKYLIEQCKYTSMCSIHDMDGCLPLHYACEHDSLEIVELVCKCNVDAISCLKNIESNRCQCETRSLQNPACGQSPLHIACKVNKPEIIEFLLNKSKANYNGIVNCIKHQTILHIACMNGNKDVVSLLTKKYEHDMCRIQDSYGCYPLHYACDSEHSSLELVTHVSIKHNMYAYTPACLTNTKLSICECKKYVVQNKCCGLTPLHIACKKNIDDIIIFLLGEENDTTPGVDCVKKQSPLHIACINGNVNIVEKLITKFNHDMVTVHDSDRRLPLHHACRHDSLQLVKLVSHGFDLCVVFQQDTHSMTPVDLAYKEQKLGVVDLLIDKSARVTNSLKQNALHIACLRANTVVAKLITAKHSSLCNVQDSDGCLPLHYACRHESLELVKLVTNKGNANTLACLKTHNSQHVCECKENSTRNDACGQTPLHIAARSSTEFNDFLIGESSQHYKVDCLKEQTILHIACLQDNLDLARRTISKYGKEICTTQDHDGCLPLHYACQLGSLKLIELVSNDFDPDMACQPNITEKKAPLELVAQNPYDDTYVPLQKKWLSTKNTQGQTLLHIACRHGNVNLVEILNAGCKNEIESICIIKDNDGCLPLHYACQHDSLELVKLVSDRDDCDMNTLSCVKSEEDEDHHECEQRNKENSCCGQTPLHIACTVGSTSIISFLLEHINGTPLPKVRNCSKQQNVLHVACIHGALTPAMHLIDAFGHDLCSSQDRDGCLPLHYASSHAVQLIKLVSKCCDLESICRKSTESVSTHMAIAGSTRGSTPLEIAAEKNKTRNVAFLLHMYTTKLGKRNRNALHIACLQGNLTVAKMLTDWCGYAICHIQDSDGCIPLHYACQQESIELVKLVSNGCNINTLSLKYEWLDCNQSRTPLHIACESCNPTIAKYIYKKEGCDISIRNDNNKTAFELWPDKKSQLHEACRSGISQLVQYVTQERDYTLKNREGRIAFELWPNEKEQFHEACKSGVPELVKYVFEVRGQCDYTAKNYGEGKTAFDLWPQENQQLHMACKTGIIELVKYLVQERKFDMCKTNEKGELPLHIACNMTNLSLVKLLCNEKIVNFQSVDQSTPLHLACSNQGTETIIFLVSEKGAKYDIQDGNGELPLHIACQKLTVKEVKLLSEKCNINTLSNNEERPIDIAVKRGELNIVSFLVDEKKCSLSARKGDHPLLLLVRDSMKAMETKRLKMAKLMITGAPRVGKSSFIKRLIGQLINELSPSTSAIAAPTLVFIKQITHTSAQPGSEGQPWKEIGIARQIANLIESGKSEEAEKLLRESVNIHVIDTGGQPEFHEILPTLVTGPALNLVLFKLNERLWERCVVEFMHQDGRFKDPYVTSYTHEDIIFQTLSSIACFTQPGDFNAERPNNETDDTGSKSAVCALIGTHKDMASPEEIQEANEYLEKQLEKVRSYYDDDLIKRFQSKTIVDISNKEPDENLSGIAPLRDFLTTLIHEHCQTIEIPPRWFSFQLHVAESGKKVLKLTECKGIAKKCGIIDDNEFTNALIYLHYHVGTLLWYRQVTMYKELVVVDIQHLYDCITELMANTFTKDAKYSGDIKEEEYDLFMDQGLFTASSVSKQAKKKSGHFSLDHLVHLLKYLHIVTSFTEKEKVYGKSKKSITYFMPCVLQLEELGRIHFCTEDLPHPLLVQFDCGFCPVGIFCCLVVELLNHPDWELNKEAKQHSNLIELRVGEAYDAVTLIARNTYYEIWIKPDQHRNDSVKIQFEERCKNVKEYIDKSLENIAGTLNYSKRSQHRFAFHCPRQDCCWVGKKRHYHIAVEEKSTGSMNFRCLISKKKCNIPSECRPWYGEKGERSIPNVIQSNSEVDSNPLSEY